MTAVKARMSNDSGIILNYFNSVKDEWMYPSLNYSLFVCVQQKFKFCSSQDSVTLKASRIPKPTPVLNHLLRQLNSIHMTKTCCYNTHIIIIYLGIHLYVICKIYSLEQNKILELRVELESSIHFVK